MRVPRSKRMSQNDVEVAAHGVQPGTKRGNEVGERNRVPDRRVVGRVEHVGQRLEVDVDAIVCAGPWQREREHGAGEPTGVPAVAGRAGGDRAGGRRAGARLEMSRTRRQGHREPEM